MIDYDRLRETYVKCVSDKNRIFMIQTFLKTYDATQKKMVPFDLFPRQKDLCQILGGPNNVVTTKPRQAGITTTVAAFMSGELTLADPEAPITILVIGNTLDLAQQMVTKIRDFVLQYPRWMWGDDFLTDGRDPFSPPTKKELFTICNTKELVLKNGCRVVARSSGPDASRGVGGVQYLIFDEAAFIENGLDVYSSALPTVSTGGRVIMISTPNGKDMLYYETCRRAELKGTTDWNGYDIVKLKWYQDPRYNKFLEWFRKNEETGCVDVVKETYLDTEGSIKFDQKHWDEMVAAGWKPRSPWYIRMCQKFNNDEQKIAQELDVSFLGSSSNVIDVDAIEMQRTVNNKEPMPKDSDGDPLFIEDTWIWKHPIQGHRYILSIDASRGDAADRTALEILDIDAVDEDGTPMIEQVLEYHGKKTGDDIGEIAFVYGMWYGEAFIVVDCVGGTGDAAVLMLMRKGYKNLYYDDAGLNKYTMQRERSTLQADGDKLPGFHSSSVRFQMLTYFANMVRTNQIRVRSKRTVQEMETWIYKGEQGRIDHMDGCHDDTLTCLAMALFVLQFSINKMNETRLKDAAMLSAWVNSCNIANRNIRKKTPDESVKMSGWFNNTSLEAANKGNKNVNNPYGQYLWVLK